ncbi:hypothetical protein [Bowmanella denitrificans]|uniref:hypothetical protein n=1 Tax=Bowmanella denitrificans TaxID=366582 RepID=UPI000C9B0722|nr:hypothetical protein [Bowmanella denitrificans]
MRGVLTLVLLACTGVTSVLAEPNTPLNWYKLDFPPYTIVNGPFKGQGLGDDIQQFIQARLSGYQHKSLLVNAARLYADLEQGKAVCTVNSDYDAQTDSRNSISLPTNIYFSYSLVSVRLSNQVAPTTLSLGQLLSDQPGALLLAVGRPYQQLDRILANFKPGVHYQTRAGQSLSEGILHMLDKGRAGYTIELCSTVRYLQQNGQFEHGFDCAQIEELPFAIGRAAVTCADNAWGHNVIAQINNILLASRDSQPYRAMMQRWYVPKDPQRRSRYWQYYQDFLLDVTTDDYVPLRPLIESEH